MAVYLSINKIEKAADRPESLWLDLPA